MTRTETEIKIKTRANTVYKLLGWFCGLVGFCSSHWLWSRGKMNRFEKPPQLIHATLAATSTTYKKMIVKGFGIKNYRSFDDTGVYLENLKKINVIIGKNNCGKSNVLRFLQLINSSIASNRDFISEPSDKHRRNDKPIIISVDIKCKDLIVKKSHQVNYSHPYIVDLLDDIYRFDYDLDRGAVVLSEKFNEIDERALYFFQNRYAKADRATLNEPIKDNIGQLITKSIRENFKDLIYIPHLRAIKEGHQFGDSNSYINGSNIISKMFEMQNPLVGRESERDKFNKIQYFVRELTNKSDLLIEIPHTKEEIVLTLDGIRLPLDFFGTGIHQLVLLCSTLVIHENSIVCIEEPEIHLHPELQRKFIRFLNETKNKYFITTHSNIFLDSNVNTSIYHVVNNGRKSEIYNANKTKISVSILNDLGYKSSDILQSNGVIWVEGPSDRYYILKWLSLLDKKLIEGIHFTIMFYGGKLLSHLCFEYSKIVNNLIPLLKLNRNAFVLMDRDGFSSKVKINKTKKRVKEEIGDKHCWITKGREIENYLSENTLCNWLNISKLDLDENVKLEELIPVKCGIKYNTDKSGLSKKIVEHITDQDMDELDLRLRLNQLLKVIYTWNN